MSTPKTLPDMIAAGRYDIADETLAERVNDVLPGRFTLEGTKIFAFEGPMETEDIVEAMSKEGYRLAMIEHLLAYGAAYPDDQRKTPIVTICLERRIIFALAGDSDERIVGWVVEGRGPWSPGFRFLGVLSA